MEEEGMRESERRDGSSRLTSNVVFDLRNVIPRRIHRNEDGSSNRSVFRIYPNQPKFEEPVSSLPLTHSLTFPPSVSTSSFLPPNRSTELLTKDIHHITHLVQLLGTDIRTVRETKVHQRPFPKEVGFREGVSILVEQGERSSDQRLAGFDRFLSSSFACMRRWFV